MAGVLFRKLSSLDAVTGPFTGLSRFSGVAVAAAGSGYVQGDVVTVSGGTAVIAAKFVVIDVDSAGGVTRVGATEPGAYTATPSNAASTTGGSGGGLTLTLSWASNSPPFTPAVTLIQAEVRSARWRDDGVNPTSSVGHLIPAGGTLAYRGDPATLKIIGTSAGGTANVTAYRDVAHAADPPQQSSGTAVSATELVGVEVGHGTAAGALRVELPTDGTGVVGLNAGTAIVGVVTTDQTTHGTTDLVAADVTKVAGVAVSQGHGTAATAVRVELPTDGTGVVTALLQAWSVSRLVSLATVNLTSVKGSAGTVGGWALSNANAAVRYLKLYDKATAPVLLVDTPLLTVAIPPNSQPCVVEFTRGVTFATGIAFALTAGVADTDVAAVSAGEVVVNLLYR